MSEGAILLKEHAERCRRLAESSGDARTSRILLDMAAEYEQRAEQFDETEEMVMPGPRSPA